MRQVSILIIYNNKGEILLQDRKSIDKDDFERGFFGGGMEEGESPEQCIEREIYEELELKDFDYRILFEHDAMYKDNLIKLFVFAMETDNLASDFKVLEGDGVKFVSIGDIQNLNISGFDKDIIDLFEKKFLGNIS